MATVVSTTYGFGNGNNPELDQHVPQALADHLCNDACVVTLDGLPFDPGVLHVRNPIYIANTSIIAGTVSITGAYWLTAAAVLLCCGVYALAVRHEEAALAHWYGAPYGAYSAATPRWIPLYSSFPGGDFCERAQSWRHVAMAECHVPLVLVPVLIPLVLR